MNASLFSHRGMRMVDRYSPAIEPPTSRAELREEAIHDTFEEIWTDAEWLEAACAYNFIHISPALCEQLIPIRERLQRESEAEDGDYRRALRELIRCIDKEVDLAAGRHIDDSDTGDAA